MTSVFELQTKEVAPLSLPCPEMTSFLAGGLHHGITELAGESASGKSLFALQLCYQVQLPISEGGLDGPAAYISTEGSVATSRLKQVIECNHPNHAEKFLNGVYIDVVRTLEEQWNVIIHRLELLVRSKGIKLIVIDSIAALFRSTETDAATYNHFDRSKELFELAAQLKRISAEHNVHILIINQVTDVFDDENKNSTQRGSVWSGGRRVKACLGRSWEACVNTRLFLTRQNRGPGLQRKLHVMFSPYMPQKCMSVQITDKGMHFPIPVETTQPPDEHA